MVTTAPLCVRTDSRSLHKIVKDIEAKKRRHIMAPLAAYLGKIHDKVYDDPPEVKLVFLYANEMNRQDRVSSEVLKLAQQKGLKTVSLGVGLRFAETFTQEELNKGRVIVFTDKYLNMPRASDPSKSRQFHLCLGHSHQEDTLGMIKKPAGPNKMFNETDLFAFRII